MNLLALVAKTRTQLNRRLAEGKKLPWPPFGPQWYAGCTTLIIGNSAKAGIRTFCLSLSVCRPMNDICSPSGKGWATGRKLLG